MKRRWSTLKQIISAYEQHHDIFLSLINEEGRIICANATMVKALRLQNPRQAETNIFRLLHPVNLSDFKTAIRTSAEKKVPMELNYTSGMATTIL